MKTTPPLPRRDFIKTCAAAGMAAAVRPRSPAAAADDRKVRLGFIGIGGRGSGLLNNLLKMSDVQFNALCDVLPRNLARAQAAVEKAQGRKPEGYGKNEEHFREMVTREDLDGVVIATPWEWHLPMAMAAMKAGKYAATEVGPANSLEECWELVRTYEQTGMPCMLLENYCYHRPEMAVLNMVRQGIFGELIHCQCGYEHDLRGRIVQGKGTGVALKEGGDFRSHHNLTRNGDIYPTHGVGPVATCLDINRGNRFVYLTSTATKGRGLRDWTLEHLGRDHPYAQKEWAIGDITTTVIKCHNGETIVENHEVTLARPSPQFPSIGRVQGTRGLWERGRNMIYIEGRSPKERWEPFDKYQAEFEHPLWRKYRPAGNPAAGHGGTDQLVLRDFVQAVKDRRPTPIDVYDTAALMVIAPLSEQSIAAGSARVDFPDFTRGKWRNNPRIFGLHS